MKYKCIEKFGDLSRLCFGCEPLGGSDWGKFKLSDIEASIRFSIEMGVNFFDTADIYGLGLSEKRLCKILSNKRHDVFIATKGGVAWRKNNSSRAETFFDTSKKYITSAVENSLNRLKIENINLYYIHWPNSDTSIEETFSCLQKLKENGKILNIGCSNFNLDQLREALKYAEINFLQTPANIIDGAPNSALMNFCKKKNINVVAYNVLHYGLLTGKFTKNFNFSSNDRRSRLEIFKGSNLKKKLKKIEDLKVSLTNTNLSLAQFSIDWVTNQKQIDFAITGIKNQKQAKENILTFDDYGL